MTGLLIAFEGLDRPVAFDFFMDKFVAAPVGPIALKQA